MITIVPLLINLAIVVGVVAFSVAKIKVLLNSFSKQKDVERLNCEIEKLRSEIEELRDGSDRKTDKEGDKRCND